MAKKFMGFKPETMAKKILPALGYDGPMDSKSIQAFLAASPAAAAKMGKYTMAARRMIEEPINAADGITTSIRPKPKPSLADRFISSITGPPNKDAQEANKRLADWVKSNQDRRKETLKYMAVKLHQNQPLHQYNKHLYIQLVQALQV